MSERKPLHSGGCQCGAVRYHMLVEPNPPSVCHCRMCQKAVGGPFALFCGIAKEKLSWSRGAPTVMQTSPVSERGFCKSCGTPLTYAVTDRDRISVTVYSLDNPEAIAKPHRQIGTENRASWLDDLNDLPGSTTQESSGANFVEACVTFQHPDHNTPDDWTSPGPRKSS